MANKFIFNVEVYCSEMDYSREVELVADWTYSPFWPGSREGGMQMEPDEPESYEISDITCNSTVPDPLELAVLAEIESCANFEGLEEVIRVEHQDERVAYQEAKADAQREDRLIAEHEAA